MKDEFPPNLRLSLKIAGRCQAAISVIFTQQ